MKSIYKESGGVVKDKKRDKDATCVGLIMYLQKYNEILDRKCVLQFLSKSQPLRKLRFIVFIFLSPLGFDLS